MTSEHTGAGDPRRTLELLWNVPRGGQGRPGPKPRLTADQIAGAAIALADAEGVDALSMRRVAERLGVGAMSLYTYVPGKAELLDLALDRVYAELSPPPPSLKGWRACLDHVARSHWELVHRHPWMLQIGTARPVLGPHLFRKYEIELAAVEGIGLTDVEMDRVVALVTGYVTGAAREAVDAAAVRSASGQTDVQWWTTVAPTLEELIASGAIDPTPYPLGNRVGTASSLAYNAASDPEGAFEFGLERLLDGIDALVRTRGDGDPAKARRRS